MIEFEKAYAAWRVQAFPIGSGLDALDELHADLALADTWVADTVIPFIERGIYSPAKVDVLGRLSEIRQRAIELAETVGGGDHDLAMEYDAYAHLQETVYQAFLRSRGLEAFGR